MDQLKSQNHILSQIMDQNNDLISNLLDEKVEDIGSNNRDLDDGG